MDEYKEAHAGSMAEGHLDYLGPIFEQLKAELLQQWAETKTSDGARREALWLEVHMVDKTLAHIHEIIETGKLARVSLEQRRMRKNG